MSRDIKLLHPELIPICEAFISACAEKGLIVGISQTYRTKAEQEEIYAQGRTTPGAIISNAPYPLSPHCWGLAFDIYRNDGKGAYNDSDGWFAKCGAVGKTMGLAWGGNWKRFVDKPHFELAKYLPNNSCNTLIAKYGTPENYIETWRDIEMTKEEFKKMLDEELTARGIMPASAWALDDKVLEQAKALGISDGSRPNALMTRQEGMAMCVRAVAAVPKAIAKAFGLKSE